MRLLYVLIVMVCLTACSMGDEDIITPEDTIVNVGDPLPTFAVTMSDGTHLSTSDLRGKPSLIVFFSTTCPDCQRELPGLNERFLAHGADTTFVAISREESADDVAAYWAAHCLSLPYSAQTDRLVYSLFARRGIPRIYISDSNGIVRKVEGG